MLQIVMDILTLPAVQGALAVVVVVLLGLLIKRFKWTKHITNLAFKAYEYAEEQGVLQGLKGYAKFDPFMDKLIELYWERFGTEPTPEIKGKAVTVMEKLVQDEKK